MWKTLHCKTNEKVEVLQFSRFHMASSARHKKSLTTEEVIEGVFADRDSENAYSENEYKSEAETETKTEKEFEEEGS